MTRATKEHLRLAIPNILSNLTVPLAGLVDTVLLGHQATAQPLAGVALAGAIFSFLYWGFVFLRMSTTGLTSKATGKGNTSEVSSLIFRSLSLALCIGTLMILLSPLIEHVSFFFLQGEAAVEAQGVAYFRGRIWGAPAVLGLMAINGWLLGRLMSKQVLILSILQNTLIIGLDYLFIWRWSWGAAGAGYATALADISTFLVAVFVVWRTWGGLPKITKSALFQAKGLKELTTLNSQIFVRSFFLIFTITSFTNISAWLGETVVSANGILLQLLLFCAYFVDGFAYALEALAGFAAGKNDWLQVKQQLRIALTTSTLTTLGFSLLFLIFSKPLFARMTIHKPVNELAQHMSPYFLLAIFVANFAYVYDGFCTGLTWGKELRTSVIVACLIGFLPLAAVAISKKSVVWLWLSYLGFSALRSAVLAYRSETLLAQQIARNSSCDT